MWAVWHSMDSLPLISRYNLVGNSFTEGSTKIAIYDIYNDNYTGLQKFRSRVNIIVKLRQEDKRSVN